VLLKERNVLATQWHESKRVGLNERYFSNKGRVIKCKQSMARILTVLNERRIAYDQALLRQKTKVSTKDIKSFEG
jgi:ribosomal protein L29